jgi:hypothetical protein
LVRAKSIGGTDLSFVDLKHRIELVWTHGRIDGGPTKQIAVEGFRSWLIVRAEVGPTKSSDFKFVDLGHVVTFMDLFTSAKLKSLGMSKDCVTSRRLA